MLNKNFILTASLAMAVATSLATQQAVADLTNGASSSNQSLLISAPLLFDGTQFLTGQAVLIQDGKITQVAPLNEIQANDARQINMSTGTILPGFIDMHTHHILNAVPPLRMLEHGVTTARDLGGPTKPVTIKKPYQLRQLISGPILSKQNGYPNNVFPGSGIDVKNPANARAIVDSLVAKGASVIAVSLEAGGEPGAPWMLHDPIPADNWPVLSDDELSAVIDQAHNVQHVRVVAYLGNEAAAQRALSFGIDEWAHMPCDLLSTDVITTAVAQNVAIDGTIDTEAECAGVHENAVAFLGAGGQLFYATDMGHPDIPHGIDAQEIHMELHAGMHSGMTFPVAITKALVSATSGAGQYLGLAPLGQIVPGAPADLIMIDSDPRVNFKELEYPQLVIKNGLVVIQRAKGE